MERNAEREKVADLAALYVKRNRPFAGTDARPPIGFILGTGWGDTITVADCGRISLQNIPGFNAMGHLEGHARELLVGTLAGRRVYVLRGRIHMNEAPDDPEIPKMVRLQTEMLMQLGVRTLIITSAVGSLRGSLNVGQIGVIDGFVTLFAGVMPLWAGEFCSPEDTLSSELRRIAHEVRGELVTKDVGYVMTRGPFFEGRRYDKALLAATGAGVVGMSMLPEACIAALYDAKTLCLGFVTNDDVAVTSHEDNLAAAHASAKHLGDFLARIVERV